MKCKVVAITGKIASGKSTVCSYLKSKGFVVVDCDKIAKEVLHQETVKQKVQNLLGENAYCNGFLNTKYVADVVFNDESLLSDYNDLVNLGVKEQIEIAQNNCQQPLLFCEIARLDAFEFSWHQIWVVKTEKTNVLVRSENRNVDYVEKVFHLQKDFLGTLTLTNDGTPLDLYGQVDVALANLV